MKKSFLKGALVMTLALGVMGATTLAQAQASLMNRDRSTVKKVEVKEEKQAEKKMDKKDVKEEMPAESKMDKMDAKGGKCCMMKGQKECVCPKCGVKMKMKKVDGEMVCKCPKCGKIMMMGDMKKCPMKADKMEKGDKMDKADKMEMGDKRMEKKMKGKKMMEEKMDEAKK